MKNIKYLLFIVIFVIFTGCANQTQLNSIEIKRNGIDMVGMEDRTKVTYLKTHGTLERFCASRETDSVKTSEQGISLGFNPLANSKNLGEESGTGAVGLGGRSPSVLISRELMFRACELSMNLNTDTNQTIEIYKLFLNAISKIVKNENSVGSKPITLSPTKLGAVKRTPVSNDNIDDDTDDDTDDGDS